MFVNTIILQEGMSYLYLLLIPIARSLIMFFDWLYLNKVYKKHQLYIEVVVNSSNEETAKCTKESTWLTENITKIRRVVGKSGISDRNFSYMEAKGFGYVAEENFTTLDNLLYLNADVQNSAVLILGRARGHFKNEAIRSLNPLYWLEVLLYLPKYFVSASGVDASSKLADTGIKVIQIVYWVMILYMVYKNPELIKVISNGK